MSSQESDNFENDDDVSGAENVDDQISIGSASTIVVRQLVTKIFGNEIIYKKLFGLDWLFLLG